MRSDTERNRRRLVNAAAYLTSRRGELVKMADVAEHAEVSVATAYRHFGSVEEILADYRYGVGHRLLEFSEAAGGGGVDLLRNVSREWVRLVVAHGQAMVHTRSEQGYLARLRTATRYLTVQADALQRPIAQAAEELGLAPPGEAGLFLWNILFDPREIFDLTSTLGLSQDEAAERLVSAFCGGLRGWQVGVPGS